MGFNITTSGPQLRGKVGHQKSSKTWHLLSHLGGGHELEEEYIQRTCGFIAGTPWIENGNIYDEDKFWLCKPNKTFTIRNHTPGMCFVDHYFLALKLGPIIRIEFIGQNMDYNYNRYKIYKIGDELKFTMWGAIKKLFSKCVK